MFTKLKPKYDLVPEGNSVIEMVFSYPKAFVIFTLKLEVIWLKFYSTIQPEIKSGTLPATQCMAIEMEMEDKKSGFLYMLNAPLYFYTCTLQMLFEIIENEAGRQVLNNCM